MDAHDGNHNLQVFFFKVTDRMIYTGRVCHIWRNFQHGYTCRTNLIFGTLKESFLKIKCLPLNNCFNCRNVLQNGIKALSKMVLKTQVFVKKLKILYISNHNLVQILPVCGQKLTIAFKCKNIRQGLKPDRVFFLMSPCPISFLKLSAKNWFFFLKSSKCLSTIAPPLTESEQSMMCISFSRLDILQAKCE